MHNLQNSIFLANIPDTKPKHPQSEAQLAAQGDLVSEQAISTVADEITPLGVLTTPVQHKNPKPANPKPTIPDTLSPKICTLSPNSKPLQPTIGALIIRIGFWGPFYYTYKKEPPN